MNLARRSKLRPPSVLTPIPEAPKSGVVVRPRGLMFDDREDVAKGRRWLSRRRPDCAHLFSCEADWIESQVAEGKPIGAQAKCPKLCPHYEQRSIPQPITLDRTLKITTRGSA
jgi:hypothetical protein